MVKRQLNADEKRLSNKNLKLIEDDLEYCNAMIEKCNMNIKHAPIIYKRQLKVIEKELSNYLQQAEELRNAEKTLKEQLRNGVEIKEEVKKENDDKLIK